MMCDRHKQGDVIVAEGGMGRAFFVVVNGEVRVDLADAPTNDPKKLGPGHYFGEFSVSTSSQVKTKAARA